MKRMCSRNWRQMRIVLAGCLLLAVGGEAAQAKQYEMTIAADHPKVTLHIEWIGESFNTRDKPKVAGDGANPCAGPGLMVAQR